MGYVPLRCCVSKAVDEQTCHLHSHPRHQGRRSPFPTLSFPIVHDQLPVPVQIRKKPNVCAKCNAAIHTRDLSKFVFVIKLKLLIGSPTAICGLVVDDLRDMAHGLSLSGFERMVEVQTEEAAISLIQISKRGSGLL